MAILVLPRTLDAAVSNLADVGPTNAKRLEKLGVKTIRDLLLTLPFGWESYGGPATISSLEPGTQATVVGRVKSIAPKITRHRRMKLTEAVIEDDGGAPIRVAWFNQPFVAKQLHRGDRVAIAGTVKRGYVGMLEMQNPHYERLDANEDAQPARVGGMMPKYHLVEGLSSRKIARWVESALPLAGQLEDLLPEDVRQRHHLIDIADAVRRGHKPDNDADFGEARRRMAFAELFELQAAFALMRANIAAEPASLIKYRQEVIDAFKKGLGFELTNAQRKATWEAFQDMERTIPMNRLLNGDVGSGKTAVAAACAAMAHASGLQTVVMAPTEILARQHLRRFRAYLEDSFPGLTVELLVSSQTAAERRRVKTASASGHCALIVGTQALIEDDVTFSNLGLAVVDEQHRFGTRQRELLRAKGLGRPHFMAMTATPIPRSLALALYGEMTLSVVEVASHVPNASVMMIEGAERFGLAQLHQFRGRAGRGAAKSWCLLLTDDPNDYNMSRLALLTSIRDGFKLAEEDMRIRGMGELMGPRQHGMSDVAMASLQQPELLSEVRQEAERIIESDPRLERHPLLKATIARRLELTSIS